MDGRTWQAVDEYFTGQLLDPDPVLDAAQEANTLAGLPRSTSARLRASCCTCSPARSAPAGSSRSARWAATRLPADGELVTCEINPAHAEVARANVARAGLDGVVDVRVGPALDTLPTLDGPFDFAIVLGGAAFRSLVHMVRSTPCVFVATARLMRST